MAEQLSLSPIQEQLQAEGVGELPDGLGTLTGKELKFVLALLRTGQMAQSAVAAGYSEDSASSIASETLKKPKVFRFYSKCLEQVSKNGDQLTRTTFERYRLFHAKAVKAAQDLADANEWLLLVSKEETGKNAKDVREYELARERAQRDERHYAGLARAEGELLAKLLGKLTVNVNGKMEHTHSVAVAPEAREQLLELQRQGVALTLPGNGRN